MSLKKEGRRKRRSKRTFVEIGFPSFLDFDLCLDRSRTDSIGRAVDRPLLSPHPKDKRLNTTHITVEFAVSAGGNRKSLLPPFPHQKFDAFLVPLSNEKNSFHPDGTHFAAR